jgi:hypothetical protein
VISKLQFAHTERHKCLACLRDIRIVYGDRSLLRGLNVCHLGGVRRSTFVLRFVDFLWYRGAVALAAVLRQAFYQREKRRYLVVGINGCVFGVEARSPEQPASFSPFRGQTVFPLRHVQNLHFFNLHN